MNRTLVTPAGAEWRLENVVHKLTLRAGLPGARVYDLAADGIRAARAAGVSTEHRLALALPASWMVNSPAASPVMRRWALAPVRSAVLDLIDLVSDGPDAWRVHSAERTPRIARLLPMLGEEPYLLEAASKLLALLAPDLVPLLPPLARLFLFGEAPLGEAEPDEASLLTRALDAFSAWSVELEDDLGHVAAELARAGLPPLEPAQVLDRLLWFDSDGHQHFRKA